GKQDKMPYLTITKRTKKVNLMENEVMKIIKT
ncbi:MAG: hypothetical protein K0R16_550, partial [Nitrososphaeraceae archaeon]|nr:hypothetical protein [Nitrososphaeraceae archaeon]MDF2769832.1 hypothetical protein [Nitrososphaeraceae archaeon]